MHEVAAAHERGVQDDRHPGDDLIAGEGGQQEDVEGGEAGDRVTSLTWRLLVVSSPWWVRTLSLMIWSSQSSVSSPLL